MMLVATVANPSKYYINIQSLYGDPVTVAFSSFYAVSVPEFADHGHSHQRLLEPYPAGTRLQKDFDMK